MDNTENYRTLTKDFVENYKKILYWPMKVLGFARFDIKNKEIVELTFSTLVYRTILLIIVNIGVGYLLYVSIITSNYLKIPDRICLIHFGTFANMLLINITFLQRRSGPILIRQSFKIDSHLGLQETKFMRDADVKTFTCLSFVIAFMNISGGIFIYKAYDDVSMGIHIIGSLFFFWLIFCYDDYCVSLLYISVIATRARYLNVALAKTGGVNVKYLSDRAMLNVLFWKKRYDELVNFQSTAGTDDYRSAFEMLFEMLRIVESLYRFPYALGFWTIVVGTFVASQTFIERIKDPNALDQKRTYIIIGWCLLSWGVLFVISLFADLFPQQIEQTRLICACIQLKPYKPDKIYKLAKTLLRLLERRKSYLTVYNMFPFETGLVLRMAAATLVYLTVQLQLAFPKLPNTKFNVTTSEEALGPFNS